MKKIILILTFLSSILAAWEWSDLWSESIREEIVERHSNGEKKLLVKYQGEGSEEVIVGRIEYNDTGLIVKEEDVVNNTIKTIEYHINNAIAKVQNYKNEKLNGEHITYHDNGQINYTLQYTNGELNKGAYAVYKDNGESITDSLIIGFSESFCENGQLKESKNVISVEHEVFPLEDGSVL